MGRKDKLIRELEQSAQSMVQGSLSELTRQCGDPSCACARDPADRHGPHLYLKFKADGKSHSVYVPAQNAPAVRSAHAAWLHFQEIGVEISTANRRQLLRDLEREKRKRKSTRGKGRRTTGARSQARD
jgi:hypothetical protein